MKKEAKYVGYKLQALDFIKRAFKVDDAQSITDLAKSFAEEVDISYADSLRRMFSIWIDEFKIKQANENQVQRVKFEYLGMEWNIPDGEDEIEIPELILPKRYKKVGIMSDLHLPYQSNEAILTALKDFKDQNVDAIYINGDLIDAYQLSRHEKNKLNRSFKYEVDMTRLFFEELRRLFKDVDVYCKIGNHDQRFDKYLMDNADQLAGLINFEDVLHMRKHRIKLVPSETRAVLGNLNILHGHETTVKGASNHSRTLLIKYQSNLMVGHFHRTDESYTKNLDGSVRAVFGTGCLCKMNPKYMAYNNWNHGYAVVEVDGATGNFEVHNKKIFL